MSFSWPVRIYWEDTDAGGVVYYANYLKFLERARTEWIRSIGFDQSALERERELLMVVKRIECDYLGSARLDDELVVGVEVCDVRGARFAFRQEIRRQGESSPIVQAYCLAACLSARTWKPRRLPPDLFDAFTAGGHDAATNLPQSR